jgi:tagaturonate epimerase
MTAQLYSGRFSLGVGDRFARQASAQLKACILAADAGVEVIPVWNKSNREHNIVGSAPESVRAAAETAVRQFEWDRPFHVDADHINLETVDRFIDSSDFFTIDVAKAIGQSTSPQEIDDFTKRHSELLKSIALSSGESLTISEHSLRQSVAKFLCAAQEAGKINRRIEKGKGAGRFIAEVSMDETESPQSPAELLVILAALADEKIPLWSIAPKFIGQFNKGVDYVGDVAEFEKQFQTDLAVLSWAIDAYGFPAELKLSVHSGSDKFSLYPVIHRALSDTGAGIHIKTAGTTWLEELIGLAEAGGDGLTLAKDIYNDAVAHREELCAPYASVIDIDASKLPSASTVYRWSSEEYLNALRHDSGCVDYNPSFRQLLHVGYKVAAKMGTRYLHMLDECKATISKNVTTNLFERHIRPLFLGGQARRSL